MTLTSNDQGSTLCAGCRRPLPSRGAGGRAYCLDCLKARRPEGGTKLCKACGETKPFAAFFDSARGDGFGCTPRCRPCHGRQTQDAKRRRTQAGTKRCQRCAVEFPYAPGRLCPMCRADTKGTPSRQPEYFATYMATKREQAIETLGGRCVACGFDNPLGLEIDHIARVGRTREACYTMYARIIAGDTENVQVLCGTCHNIKTRTEG